MPDNIIVATTNDVAGAAHQKVVNEYLDAGGLPVPVTAATPLPVLASISTAGLATSTGQTTGNNSLASIDAKLTNPLPVSAAALPLPAGAATETTTAALNAKIPTGLTVTAGKLQVELPPGGSGLTDTELRATPVPISGTVTTGGLTDTQLRATPVPVSVTGGGDASAANQTTGNASLSSIDGKTPALGQALAADSSPVVLTAAQVTTLTPPAAITGYATSAKQDSLLTELQLKADLTETQPVSVAALPLPTGAATAANQQTNALTDTQLRATPVPISGTITATPTGTQNVDVTANTIGLSTAAKQDLLLTELQGKADLTDTQPVSLASVPSHPVTNAGTFAVQSTISAALPTGTNSIGQVTANAGTNLNTSALALDSTVAKDASLSTLNTSVNTLLKPASTLAAVTTVGTVSAVTAITNALPAGTNIIGKVGIDQTTPGTTNKVNIGTDGQVATNGTIFTFSTVNSTVAQLAASATFPGVVESVVSQQSYSVLFFSDQNATITILQYIDAGGLKLISSLAFTYTAGGQFARSGVMNGNFIKVTVQNTGGSTTTTLQLDTAFGEIPSATQFNNSPISINEVGGTAVTAAGGLPVKSVTDTGRNQTNYFMVAPIITTAAEVMQSLTGYKSGAAVAATVTPAVVTAAKTYRITQIIETYFNVATVGSARFTLRANTAGVAVIGSPLVWSHQIGISGDGASTAGHVTTVTHSFPDGMDFAAATGIAVGMQGFGAVPTTGTIVGYGKIEILGYEY